MTFWGHGDGPGALPGEAEAGQEGAGLGEAAAEAGEVGDPLDGLGRGADGAFGQRLPDERGTSGEVGRGAASGLAAFKAVESAVAVGEDGPLGGGNADVGRRAASSRECPRWTAQRTFILRRTTGSGWRSRSARTAARR